MADITFVGAGTVVSNGSLIGTTGLTLSPHASQLAGDFLLAVMHRNQDDGSFDAAPSGWTLLDAQSTSAGQDTQTAIYYRIATADSESSTTFTHSDTTAEQWSGCILVFRGVFSPNPLDVTYSSGSHFTSSTNKPTPNTDTFQSITTVTNGAVVVAFEAVTHDDITSNADPSGYTNAVRAVGTSHNWRQFQVWYKEVATAGSETPGAAAYTSSDTTSESHRYTIALQPAPDDVDVDLNAGSYTLTGNAITIDVAAADVDVDLDAGSYSLTGNAIDILPSAQIELDTGAYTLSGQDLDIITAVQIELDAGSYSLTGNAIDILASVQVDLDSGTYSLTGNDLTILPATNIDLDAGAYSLAGNDLDILPSVQIDLDAGSYTFAGQDLNVNVGGADVNVDLALGQYTLTGNAIDILPAAMIELDTGSYALTGNEIEIDVDAVDIDVDLDTGSYTLTGHSLDLVIDNIAQEPQRGGPALYSKDEKRKKERDYAEKRALIAMLDEQYKKEKKTLAKSKKTPVVKKKIRKLDRAYNQTRGILESSQYIEPELAELFTDAVQNADADILIYLSIQVAIFSENEDVELLLLTAA